VATGSLLVAFAMAAGCGIDTLATGTVSDAGSSSDAPLLDGPPRDTAPDAAPPPLGTPGFCAREAKPFVACWDFDGVPAGGDPGFTSKLGAPIDVAVEGESHVLRISVPSVGGPKVTFVERDLAPMAPFASVFDVRFAFSVRSTSLDYAAFAAFFLTAPAALQSKFVGAASYGKGNKLDMLANDLSAATVPAQPGAMWHSARIRVVGQTGSVHGTTAIDGIAVGDEMLAVDRVSVDLRLGVYFTSTEVGTAEVVFDEIVIRAE
jgi:hypothetical protein